MPNSLPINEVLVRIQRRLVCLYGLRYSPHVGPFLCSAEVAAAAGGDVERGELLLVADDGDDVSIGLYVAPEAMDALRHDPDVLSDPHFDAYCLAAEGVSHFVYLTYRVEQTRSVSEFELELQAEVDKYAGALLEGNGVGAIRERSRLIRQRLYREVALVDEAGSEKGERYRRAIQFADAFTFRLQREYVDRGAIGPLVQELRAFYRSTTRQKLKIANG